MVTSCPQNSVIPSMCNQVKFIKEQHNKAVAVLSEWLHSKRASIWTRAVGDVQHSRTGRLLLLWATASSSSLLSESDSFPQACSYTWMTLWCKLSLSVDVFGFDWLVAWALSCACFLTDAAFIITRDDCGTAALSSSESAVHPGLGPCLPPQPPPCACPLWPAELHIGYFQHIQHQSEVLVEEAPALWTEPHSLMFWETAGTTQQGECSGRLLRHSSTQAGWHKQTSEMSITGG